MYTLVSGERLNGIQEVSGSIPLISTKLKGKVVYYPPLKMRRVSLCRNVHNIHAQTELLKVDVEVKVQLVVPVRMGQGSNGHEKALEAFAFWKGGAAE